MPASTPRTASASTAPGPVGGSGDSTPDNAARTARILAVAYTLVVLLAVLWPSGSAVAEAKDALGPWFLGAGGKDVLLNLVMLAPLTFLAALGWPQVPWWAWALAGCGVGAGAELCQLLAPVLDRRASWANVGQNALGAWAGAGLAVAVRLLRRR